MSRICEKSEVYQKGKKYGIQTKRLEKTIRSLRPEKIIFVICAIPRYVWDIDGITISIAKHKLIKFENQIN